MRGRGIIILAAVLLLVTVSIGGCRKETKELFSYKEQLDEEQLAVYEAFESAVFGNREADPEGYYPLLQETNKEDSVAVTDQTALCAYQAFLYDHPELVLLERGFSYRRETADGNSLIEAVRPEYFTVSDLDVKSAEDRLAEAARTVIAGIPKGASEKEAADYLYHYLIREVQYCEEAVYDPSLKMEHTAYGALVNRRAVCDGIALAYVYLLRECGISCAAVPGQAGGMSHVWVVLQVDGVWTEADPTWGIIKGDQYFGLTTAQMSTDHEREMEGPGALAPVSE